MRSFKAYFCAGASLAAVAVTASGSLATLGMQGQTGQDGQKLKRRGTLIAPHRTPAPVTGTQVTDALDIDPNPGLHVGGHQDHSLLTGLDLDVLQYLFGAASQCDTCG